ncbi:MAG: glycosyltransferase family 39 protein [Eubacteriales bacterium]|nr:glycosyltransferase family 39 protein [Eubacteriales bacterium]
MRKLLAILLLFCLILVPAAALADGEDTVSGGELIYNGDFGIHTESAELPAGWELSAYQNDSSSVTAFVTEDEDGAATIAVHNLVANDSRVCQTVSISPDSIYRLRAEIRTSDVEYGTGATLSIDNYAIDGTYCYSENLFGSDAWRTVSLYFHTGTEQTSANVALRLGGYGTTAIGTAEFRNVSLVKITATDEEIVDLPTQNGTVTNINSADEAQSAPSSANVILIFSAAVTLACAGIYAYLYRKELRYDNRMLEPVAKPYLALLILLIGAFVLRLILSLAFHGHPTDLGCFMAWGNMMLDGAGKFYTSGAFTDYPPGYMYICGALSWICRALSIPYDSEGMAFLFKLPSTIADLIGTWLLYRMAKKQGLSERGALLLAALFAFCPVLMFVSGAWGQIDSLLALLLVLVVWLLQSDRRILAGAVYGIAILVKPQALMLGPVLAVAFVADIVNGKQGWFKRLGKTVLAVLAAVAALFVLSLPFQGTQNWDWLIQKYISTAGSYHYASIEAFNFGALIGGNWKTADMLFLGIPYYLFGTGMIVLSVAFCSVLYLFGRKRSKGALYLGGALAIVLIFTFGHYMHERYLLPALLMLLVAYSYYRDRRLLIAFGGMSITALLNATTAMYVVNHTAARAAFYEGITFVGSLSTVLFAIYFAWVSFRILVSGETAAPLYARETGESDVKTRGKREILPKLPTDNKLHYSKRDMLYVLGITLVYGIVALTNLGSLRAPQTFWSAETAGESITVRFDRTEHIAAYGVFGNIDKEGTLLISTAQGHEETFEQTYDDMFRWKKVTTDFSANEVTLTLYSGTLKLNEMAFFDENDQLIPVTVVSPNGSQNNLFDEQDQVDAVPSYYNGMYFDELYHGRTAYENLHNLTPYENSHPPLGKLLIMLGVWAFGMTPFGWRVVGALFGIGMLPVLYAFGKRLFKDSNYALVLTTLFAFDFMHFTQTRIATIDVYSVFFILLMYYYMYQYITMNFFVDGVKMTLKPLALSGLFFGIGAACKWTSIYAGAGLAILLFGSLIARYLEYARVNAQGSEAERTRVSGFWQSCLETVLWCALFFVAVPIVIYFASYTPYYIYESGQNAEYHFKGMLDTFWKYQTFMYDYHSHLNATHPYQSNWYSWPFTVKPMWYYFNSYTSQTKISTMSASGNPAVWWVSTIGAFTLLGLRVSKKIAPDRAMQIFCAGVLANYLPWVLVPRCTFIYHFFATVPFILMATVYALQLLEKRCRDANFLKWVWVGFALLFFILLYPGLSGLPVSPEWAAFLSKIPGGKLMYGA